MENDAKMQSEKLPKISLKNKKSQPARKLGNSAHRIACVTHALLHCQLQYLHKSCAFRSSLVSAASNYEK